MSGATYLVTVASVCMCVCMLGWLIGWLLAHTLNFKNFIGSQRFQNENMFQTILSNFDFQIPDPHHHHHQKWETPDLAWCKLGLKNFFSNFLFNFLCKFFLGKLPKFKIIGTKMHCRRFIPHLWPLTNFIRFQNFLNQMGFGSFWATLIFGPYPTSYPATCQVSYLAIHLVIYLLSYSKLTQV